MKTTTQKTWQHLNFIAEDNDENAVVELIVNHQNGTFEIHSHCEESVSFKRDTLSIAKLRNKAIEAALNWVEENLENTISKGM